MIAPAAVVPLDPATCAQEPIHIPGAIQPFGILIVLAPDLTIKNISANIEALFGRSATSLSGAGLSTILGQEGADRFAAATRLDDFAAFNPTRFVIDARGSASEFECTVHRSAAGLVVELEPYDMPIEPAGVDLYAHARTPIARMEEALDLTALARVAAVEVLAISGFDRAMVYRFDEDWNGEVIAEAKTAAAPIAYLGLHFPASDIPAQARRLYLTNTLRLIPDVDYAPAPLVPEFDPVDGLPIDLSRAVLRNVSPYHIDYLKQMGVRATLTISIIIRGKLWGLVACHHYEPRRLDYGRRAVCELLGHMLAWQIGSRLESDALQEELRTNALLSAYSQGSSGLSDLAAGIVAGAAGMCDLFASRGLAISVNGEMSRVGACPGDNAAVAAVAVALHAQAVDGVAVTRDLRELGVPATETASGAILVELSEDGDEYLLCFRPEIIQSVVWGGDPRKTSTDSGLRPRESFAAWRETMRGNSSPWSPRDRSAAGELRRRILDRRRTIERGHAEAHIRHLAHYDTLTQIPNRATFHDALSRSIREAASDGSSLAVLFVDLDRLKVLNDSFGHEVGDRILQVAAARLRGSVRRDDLVARLGGDEFVVILKNIASARDADHVAVKILAAIAEPVFVPGNPELRFTASVGIAIYPQDATDSETLLRHADRAMYRAKQHGRNDFQRFGSGDAAPTYEGLALERQLQRGIRRNEIVPFYQPIVSARDGGLWGMEALARWNHPNLGLLQPAHFIALAEESQLIGALGAAMLRAACTDCVGWRTIADRQNTKVSVNVSAKQFRDQKFLQTTLNILAETKLNPEALQLEITESVLVGDESYALETLEALTDVGVSLAIDDFGTGYSSLSYLKRLPVDALKIDRSFIADITPRPDDTAIVRAIIAMAHSLKLDVIAEGVETNEQREFLGNESCDLMQGFLIGRPLEYQAATAFIQ